MKINLGKITLKQNKKRRKDMRIQNEDHHVNMENYIM